MSAKQSILFTVHLASRTMSVGSTYSFIVILRFVFHRGKGVGVHLLGCNAVCACRKYQRFGETLNMEAVCSSETLVSTYKSTWR
jgi:hypothetical protein